MKKEVGEKKKNSDDSATALWNGEQEGYCGCPQLIGKEPQYLPSPSIIKAVTAVEKPAPALKHDWHSFDEADGQLQGSRLLGRHWPERESDWRGRRGGLWEGRARDASELLRILGGWWAAASRCLLLLWLTFSEALSHYCSLCFWGVFFPFFFWVHVC